MAYDPERIVNIGELEKRGKTVRFGIKEKDRSRHIYVIGQTGTGKSTLLEMLAMQDIRNGTGLIFMDPHGQSVEALLNYVTREHLDKIIYFAPHHQERPIGLNIMEDIGYDKRHLVVSSLMASFEKIWGAGTWSDRMAYILQNTLLALIEYPGTTLLDVGRMYTSKDFREKVVANLKDPQVRKYWVEEFANYTERYAQEATPSIQNKLGQFTSNPLMRNIIGQKDSAFNFREIMDEGKILLVNLSKGQIGENNARMLGVLFTTKIYLAALSRSDMTKPELEAANPCNFFVDEFQSFANSSFSDILSEARKYKLNLVMAHQYLGQLYSDDAGGGDVIRDAVFGNVGTFVSFRVGPVDAEIISKQFAPDITEEDLVALPRYHIYLTLNIDGAGSVPFSARTFYEPAPEGADSLENEVVQRTMDTYGVDRAIIEKMVEDNLAEDERANEAAKKSGGQQKGKQQGWGKKPGGNQQRQHGGQDKNNETHTPLKGLVRQAMQQQEATKPKKQTVQDDGAKKEKKVDKKTAKSVQIQHADTKDQNEKIKQTGNEKQKKSLFGKLFAQKEEKQEKMAEHTEKKEVVEPEIKEHILIKQAPKKEAPKPEIKEQMPIKQIPKKEVPNSAEEKPHRQDKKDAQQEYKPSKKQDSVAKPENAPIARKPKPQHANHKKQDSRRERVLKGNAPERKQNTGNTERRHRQGNQQRKGVARMDANQRHNRNQPQHRNRNAHQEERSPARNERRQNEREKNTERNTNTQQQRNQPQKSTIQTRQEKSRPTKKQEKSEQRPPQPHRQKKQLQQPINATQRLPSGVTAGTVSRTMTAQPANQQANGQPEKIHKQQHTPQKQNRQQQANNTTGELGDLVKSAKTSGLQKDLKVKPKKQKQAPPVSYEEGWVAIGDMSKVSE